MCWVSKISFLFLTETLKESKLRSTRDGSVCTAVSHLFLISLYYMYFHDELCFEECWQDTRAYLSLSIFLHIIPPSPAVYRSKAHACSIKDFRHSFLQLFLEADINSCQSYRLMVSCFCHLALEVCYPSQAFRQHSGQFFMFNFQLVIYKNIFIWIWNYRFKYNLMIWIDYLNIII